MEVTALSLAKRHIGVAEINGEASNPLISWWHSLCGLGMATPDDVPWCSSFANGIAWLLDLERSKSAAARSWLKVGESVNLALAQPGFDVVVLTRGAGAQPGPEVIYAPGHVGFYAGRQDDGAVIVVGGNQGDRVTAAGFPASRVLGVRRLRGVKA